MRRSIIVGLTGLALLTGAATASAQQYPPAAPQCAVDDSTPAPGETITLSCAAWAPNSVVTPTLFSEPRVLDPIPTDALGRMTAGVRIPADTPPGPHTLRLSGLNARGQATHVDLAITVAGDATADPDRAGVVPSPRLPRTGGEALLLVATAAGLLFVGSASVVAAARQRKSGRSTV